MESGQVEERAAELDRNEIVNDRIRHAMQKVHDRAYMAPQVYIKDRVLVNAFRRRQDTHFSVHRCRIYYRVGLVGRKGLYWRQIGARVVRPE